jgi:hypothetical protein
MQGILILIDCLWYNSTYFWRDDSPNFLLA